MSSHLPMLLLPIIPLANRSLINGHIRRQQGRGRIGTPRYIDCPTDNLAHPFVTALELMCPLAFVGFVLRSVKKYLASFCSLVLCRRASFIYSDVLHPLNSIADGGGEGLSPKNPTPEVSYLYLPPFVVRNCDQPFMLWPSLTYSSVFLISHGRLAPFEVNVCTL